MSLQAVDAVDGRSGRRNDLHDHMADDNNGLPRIPQA
jgi:hypothetical protein